MTALRAAGLLGALTIAPLASGQAMSATLEKRTVEAFDAYIARLESETASARQGEKFLWCRETAARRDLLRARGVIVEPKGNAATTDVPGGLIHDWVGAVYLPGATLEATLELLRNYDNHKRIYAPEVVDSRVLSRDGDRLRSFLRLKKQKIITVVLNTEYDVTLTRPAEHRASIRSQSVKTTEVKDVGTPNEHELPPGEGYGFLWRLYSYWRLEETDGGVWAECEAVSLTRDVPALFKPIILPIVRDLPKESFEKTLQATRAALAPQSSPR
jgi:hypothetical protein